jgi:hypothetical protein
MKCQTKNAEAAGLLYTAVIGDMLASRSFSGSRRAVVQQKFSAFVDALNADPRYRSALASKFTITLGDEFQGILKDASIIPDLIWDIAHATDLPVFRLGIGYGTIDTKLPMYAINLDGPALHAARNAIADAKGKRLLGGVFRGFGEEVDLVANGLSRMLQSSRDGLTAKQDQILGILRKQSHETKMNEVEVAAQLRVSKQTINKQKHAANMDSFIAGEQALRAILKLATKRLAP